MMHWESYEKDITGRCVRTMKKQIQLYYDPEDETYKTLISAKNKTYLLDVCYKFSVEFYKCQMKEENPDSEEVICYLIAMMYLMRQGGSLPGIAARGAGGTEEWLWGRTYQPMGTHQSSGPSQLMGMHSSSGSSQPMGTHSSEDPGQPMDTHQSSGSDHPMGTYSLADTGQPRDMSQSTGMGQPTDMHQPAGMHQSADMQSAGLHQSTDLQSSDMDRHVDMPATSRYQAEDGHKENLGYMGDSGNWQADGNPALASVMADVEII